MKKPGLRMDACENLMLVVNDSGDAKRAVLVVPLLFAVVPAAVISLLLVLGIGLNYALFFQRRSQPAEREQHARLAVTRCGATSLDAFVCLALSCIPVLHGGLECVLGTLFSLFNLAALNNTQRAN